MGIFRNMKFSTTMLWSILVIYLATAINQYFFGFTAALQVCSLSLIALIICVRIRADLIARFYSWT